VTVKKNLVGAQLPIESNYTKLYCQQFCCSFRSSWLIAWVDRSW